MAIPTADREQLLVSATSQEIISSSVICKSSYWAVFMSYERLTLKEYQGAIYYKIRDTVPIFHLSIALNSSKQIITDRFWLWEITTMGSLNFLEIEPFSDRAPIIHEVTQLISSNVLNVKVDIQALSNIRVYILKDTVPKELWLYIYSDIKSGIPLITSQRNWSDTRLNNFDTGTQSNDRSIFNVAYVDVVSPPNVYQEDNTLSVPQIISAQQLPESKRVSIEWDTIMSGEMYRLERSIADPTFAPANTSVVYYGPDTIYIDDTPFYGTTYWYRVKLVMPSLALESLWSTGYSVVVFPYPLYPDFIGTPLEGQANLTVTFKDQTIGFPTAWVWDFGDGTSNSTEQSPVHIYTKTGSFTVRLTATGPGGTDYEEKSDYIMVRLRADFIPTPDHGPVPLTVQFTDTSQGNPTSWLWEFNDGSPDSTEQNPIHTFLVIKIYNVMLTVGNATSIDDSTDKDITISVNGAFRGASTKGYSPLIVYFVDKSTGSPIPNYWEWDFGDGSAKSYARNPVHKYTALDKYTVTLTTKVIENDVPIPGSEITITKSDYIFVTSLKDEIIAEIKSFADNYGSPEVIDEIGTSGYAWERDPDDKYHPLETIVEGLATAIIGRTVERGEPFDGALIKKITEFIKPDIIRMNNTRGIIENNTFGINSSAFNNGGKNVSLINLESQMPVPPEEAYIKVIQRIHDETPSEPIETIVGPPDSDKNIETTINIIQACISDNMIRDNATETVYGLVKKGAPVDLIYGPSTPLGQKINELIIALTNAGWI